MLTRAVWRCPVVVRKDQCQDTIIWFNEVDDVKPQLAPALEHAEPHTPKKKEQKLINGYLTPSSRRKPNELLKENESSEGLGGGFESKPGIRTSMSLIT